MQNDKKRPATNTITDRNYQLKFKDGSIEQLTCKVGNTMWHR